MRHPAACVDEVSAQISVLPPVNDDPTVGTPPAGKWRHRVALLTGANGNVGERIARGLAAKGVHVALAGLDNPNCTPLATLEAQCSARGVRAKAYGANLSCPNACRDMVDQVAKDFGRLDMVVYAAGVFKNGAFEKASMADLHLMINVNLLGFMAVTHAALPHVLKSDRGHIVGISSLAGQVGIANEVGYCASKFGMRGFAHALAAEYAQVALAPGEHAPAIGVLSPSLIHSPMAMGRGFDLQRAIMPEDAARAIIHQLGSSTRTAAVEITLASKQTPYRAAAG